MNKFICIILIIISLNSIAGEALIYEKKIHTDSVDSICVKGKVIYSASFDGTIKRTVDNISKLVGKHKDWVRKVICKDSNIITASNDGMITIWKDLKKVRSVKAHSWWVTDIALSNRKIVSVSLDEYVKVWSYPELKLLYSHKIVGSNKHYSVVINNGKAFVGSTRGYMHVLDLINFGTPLKINISGHEQNVLLSAVNSTNHIVFGASDGLIIKVSASPPYSRDKKKISDFSLKAIVEKEGVLYVGDEHGVLRKINMNNLKKSTVVNHFPEAIRALAINDDFIYAGYDNGYIRIFDNKTGISGK